MKLSDAVIAEPFSRALRLTRRFAGSKSATNFLTWLDLELGGYESSNPAMSSDVVVPTYRTVVAHHYNIAGQCLMLPLDFHFVNEVRLRESIEVLEDLRTSRRTVAIHDPNTIHLIST